MKVKILLTLKTAFLLLIVAISSETFAQCNVAGFTATKTNGTCFANGSIAVQVPGALNCTNWIAIHTPPSGPEQSTNILSNGTSAGFSSLPVGNYNVRLFNGSTTVQAPNNPIVITTSYVNMNITSTNTQTTFSIITPLLQTLLKTKHSLKTLHLINNLI